MINTYTTSYTPPSVPPRLGSRAPERGHVTPLVWFLSSVLVLHMAGCLGGFFYLYHRSGELQDQVQGAYHEDLVVLRRLRECEDSQADSTTLLDCRKILDTYTNIIAKLPLCPLSAADLRRSGAPFHNSAAVAHMIVDPDRSRSTGGKTLRWKQEHSLLVNVVHVALVGTLRIRVSGDYYIYSQVTFSRRAPKTLLLHSIVQRGAFGRDPEKVLLKSYCGMDGDSEVCTSFQGGVFQLEKGEELRLNVTDTALVHLDSSATTFGLFMV
ncbi:CD40 ligand-like [Arapaima gigas]